MSHKQFLTLCNSCGATTRLFICPDCGERRRLVMRKKYRDYDSQAETRRRSLRIQVIATSDRRGKMNKMRKPVLLKVTFRSKKDTALAEPAGVISDVVSRTTHLGGRCILLRVRPSTCGTWADVSKFREMISSAPNVQSVRRKLRQSL